VSKIKIAFIAKGNSKKAHEAFKDLSQILKEFKNLDAEVFYTKQAKEAIKLTQHAINNNFTHVIACGGDGTAFEVLNGLMTSPKPETVFGVFPIGSANDFARAQKLTYDLKQFIYSITKTKQIDCGFVSFTNLKKETEQAYFLNICEVGFGPEAVKKVNAKPHFWPVDFSFLVSITQTFFSYKRQIAKVNFNDVTWQNKLLIASFANSNCLGGGIFIAPDAKLDDGLLDVTFIGDVNTFDYFTKIGQLKKGQKINHPQIEYHQTQKATISSALQIGIEADGEYLGTLPANVELLPGNINFVDSSL